MFSRVVCVRLILHERVSTAHGHLGARRRRGSCPPTWGLRGMGRSHPASSLPYLRAPLQAWVAPWSGLCPISREGNRRRLLRIVGTCGRPPAPQREAHLRPVTGLPAQAEPALLWGSVWFLNAVSTQQTSVSAVQKGCHFAYLLHIFSSNKVNERRR